jgi:RimJ/RimL family protein N-acetyltransferase
MPSAIVLHDVTDAHFAWMLGEMAAPDSHLHLPPGGIDDAALLAHVRRLVHGLTVAAIRGAWMIVCADEVVGLCSYHRPPRNGEAEIGYGIAPSRRNRGYATAAIAAVIERARADGLVALTAETAVANIASSTVLTHNGFIAAGERTDPEDGPVHIWSRTL